MKIQSKSKFQKNVDKYANYTLADIQNNANMIGTTAERSFNYDNVITSKTKAIIVGTFTPISGRNNGYFYTSCKEKGKRGNGNQLYKIIDSHFGTCLDELKEKLNLNKKDQVIINQIKNELKSINIAFLDVIDCAASRNLNASDDEIEYFNLDYNSFNNLLNPIGNRITEENTLPKLNDVVFICNSRNSQYALENYIYKDINVNIEYAPQISYTLRLEEKQKIWDDIFNRYGL